MQSPISTSPVPMPGLTVPSGRSPHRAGHRDDLLAAHVDGVVDHALDDARVVAQVDEGEVLAVLAAPGHPAAERARSCRRRTGAAPRRGGCASRWAGSRGLDVASASESSPRRGAGADAGAGRRHRRAPRRTPLGQAALSSSTMPARGTVRWSSRLRRGRSPTVPSATSWAPTTRATRAPERSADLIWDFIERPSKARSARRPARRSSAVSATAASPPAVSTT